MFRLLLLFVCFRLQSSDEEEGILDWDLPNLSTTSDPSECPYGPESLALSLQALDSHYNHQVVLRLCQDWQVWPAAAQICELDKNYPLALLYRLKDRQCKGTVIIGAGEEGVLQEITALVDKFIRLVDKRINFVDRIIRGVDWIIKFVVDELL